MEQPIIIYVQAHGGGSEKLDDKLINIEKTNTKPKTVILILLVHILSEYYLLVNQHSLILKVMTPLLIF